MITASHYNCDSGLLTLIFVNQKFSGVYDLANGASLFWNLPDMKIGQPLCMKSDMDKMLIAYDSNKIVIFDLINRKLHDWSKDAKLPANFLNRYNRMVGVDQLSSSKYILWSHYTYTVLDITVEIPHEV